MTDQKKKEIDFAELLKAAVETPGIMLEAYRYFHNYSVGNQIAAIFQCSLRGLQIGPIASYNRWQELGRQVKKGSKAICLCMPVTCKGRERKNEQGEIEQDTFTRFTWRNNWFVLCQTEGAELEPAELPNWDKSKALGALEIDEIEFDMLDGNCQGFAKKRSIAISPIAALPHKTLFHELGHVVLGHTAESDFSDSETTPRSLREVEAESVAMLCCESLGMPGADYCRGYIQHWIQGAEIPEKSAQKIFKAADLILKSGQGEESK